MLTARRLNISYRLEFTSTIDKGRLQREMVGERDGVVRGRAKVDAATAATAKPGDGDHDGGNRAVLPPYFNFKY